MKHKLDRLLVCFIILMFCINAAALDVGINYKRKVMYFKEGVHTIKSIHIKGRNVALVGMGPGVTVLKVEGGIRFSGSNPVIKNMTIIGNGKGTGIMFENTWRGVIENVNIQNYGTGILLELNADGRKFSGGVTQRSWPYDTEKSRHWGSRLTLTEIKNVQILGPGNGIVMRNKLKKTSRRNYWWPTNDKKPGEFINATTIWGGHIGVKKTGVIIGQGVYTTKIIGTYIDASDHGGIYMEYGSRGLTLIGVSLDPNSYAKRKKAPILIFPAREKRSVHLIGTPIKRSLIRTH